MEELRLKTNRLLRNETMGRLEDIVKSQSPPSQPRLEDIFEDPPVDKDIKQTL
eukprot:TRINITY_DN873_c0_g1_i1.p3 TRINITY_DN873_c0_g1~~TRINITY_DN873_c0_g1_i1.p3  ORF type:complete len:53 (-),score=6.18 TRINITY_DN873_c0_g1_i1:180-338(-)